MIRFISKIPIFRRLFFAFALAAVIPDLVILFISTSSLSTLREHGVGPIDTNPLMVKTVVALIATTGIVVAIGWLMNHTITQPLRQLDALTKRIAKGNTSARAKVEGRDEIAKVAAAMNNMLDNIVYLIQQAQEQRDLLQSQVEKLVSEVSGVGEGDLRIQAEVTADALGVLADSFNYMVEELGSLIVRVKAVATEAAGSTATILDGMMLLVQAGDEQVNSIGEAGIEVERMAGASRQVAERSQLLFRVAGEAHQDAQRGRMAVELAVAGIGRMNENVQETARKVQVLGDRSREIEDIVTTVGNIAHQTNRLALDAAIQAAMAGANGKGFGAVAADIRRLAEKTKDLASSINRNVRSVREDIGAVALSMRDTQRETEGGTQLTQEAGTALESVFAAVEHQAKEIENISRMAGLQLQSSSAVVQIMQLVTESTQQSGENTRGAAQSMERLARLIEQLRSSVEAFKIRDDQNYLSPHMEAYSAGGAQYGQTPAEETMTVSGVFRTVSAVTPYAGREADRNQWTASTPSSPVPQRYG